MNFLRVIPSMNPEWGGPCQGIRNSIPELIKLGINNEVVCLDDPLSSYLQKDTFKIHAIGKGKGSWMYSSQLEEWLDLNLHRFEIVIIHGMWLYHGYLTMKIISKWKKQNKGNIPKVFVMPHGMLDPWFQRAEGRKVKAIRNWLYWQLIENKVVNNADGLLFTSEEELSLARQTFKGYRPKRELNIGYGIISPPPSTDELVKSFKELHPELGNNPYLLFLSRINVKKGVDLLINSYIHLKSQGVILPKLIIAGPGSDTAYGNELKKLVNSEPDIIFTGMLSGNSKWGAFYGCEAFILPSHQENFGIAVAEALACGKPVLISDQVNIWKEIEHENAGIIENDTEDGVLKMLTKWVNLTNTEKHSMGILAKNTFTKYFTIQQAAKKMVAQTTQNI